MKNLRKLGWMLLFLCSCFSSPAGKYQAKGKKVIREIVKTLQDVENHEELLAATPQLKKQFKKLAVLLVEMRDLKTEPLEKKEPLQESEALFAELARLYEIPGCREIIERSQMDAVYVLLRN